MGLTRKLSFFLLISWNSLALAHGEDKPGPHGGVMRMPGAFHTEVLKNDRGGVKVFLLDMNWQNPTVEDSTVEATIIGKEVASKLLSCRRAVDHFVCEAEKPEQLAKAEKLQIKAKRKGSPGGLAEYPFPLVK